MFGSGVRQQIPDVLSSAQLKNLELKSLTSKEYYLGYMIILDCIYNTKHQDGGVFVVFAYMFFLTHICWLSQMMVRSFQ